MYFYLLLIVFILVLLVMALFFFIRVKKIGDFETFSSYECGFNLISLTRIFFSFRFFLITVLFLIFDVEIVLIIPIPFLARDPLSLFSIYLFIGILILGLIYEYYYGSLNWLNFISKA